MRATWRWLVMLLALQVGAFTAPAAAQQSFAAFVAGLWPEARADGVSRATFDAAFAGVQPNAPPAPNASQQAEFASRLGDYLHTAVSDWRITTGQRLLAEHDALLDRIEATFGVPRYVVVAIWAIESAYGTVLSNPAIVRDAITALATLAYSGSRMAYGRQQLRAALRILETGVVEPRQMTSSWAGAMGHTQFTPTSYEAYAVDFDGDGRRDVWHSIPDALASTANYLDRMGWVAGTAWGYEVALPNGFDYRLADNATRRTISDWQMRGVARTVDRSSARQDEMARLWAPVGAGGPAFLLLANFNVIKRYNNADSYALAVGYLADRLSGAGPLVAAWPRNELPLTAVQRRELQTLLNAAGFNAGTVDGIVGPRTLAALRAYQTARGLPADASPSLAVLELLRAEVH